MLKNGTTLAIRGVDTEENEHSEVCPLSAYRSPRLAERMSNYDVDLEDVGFMHDAQRVHYCQTICMACLRIYEMNSYNHTLLEMITRTLQFMGSVGLAPAPTEVHDILAPVSVKSFVFF